MVTEYLKSLAFDPAVALAAWSWLGHPGDRQGGRTGGRRWRSVRTNCLIRMDWGISLEDLPVPRGSTSAPKCLPAVHAQVICVEYCRRGSGPGGCR